MTPQGLKLKLDYSGLIISAHIVHFHCLTKLTLHVKSAAHKVQASIDTKYVYVKYEHTVKLNEEVDGVI